MSRFHKLTQHAKARMQSRGVPNILVDLLLSHGAETRTNEGYIRFFDKPARRRLARALGGRRSLAALEPLLNCYLVEADSGALVTVGHRYARIKRDFKSH